MVGINGTRLRGSVRVDQAALRQTRYQELKRADVEHALDCPAEQNAGTDGDGAAVGVCRRYQPIRR